MLKRQSEKYPIIYWNDDDYLDSEYERFMDIIIIIFIFTDCI